MRAVFLFHLLLLSLSSGELWWAVVLSRVLYYTPPTKLNPNFISTYDTKMFYNLVSSGLYSYKDTQSFMSMITSGPDIIHIGLNNEKKMYESQLDSINSQTLANQLAEEGKGWFMRTWDVLWSWLLYIGHIGSGLLGVMIIWQILNYFTRTFINGKMLFRALGLSWRMLHAVHSSWTHQTLEQHRVHVLKQHDLALFSLHEKINEP